MLSSVLEMIYMISWRVWSALHASDANRHLKSLYIRANMRVRMDLH